MANEAKKDYSKLVKAMQIVTGILLVVFVIIGVYLINKYNIKVSNIKNLSQMIQGGALMVSLIIIGVSVVKSFALVFPPAVIMSICGYMLPNLPLAIAVNVVSVFLSLSIPYFLGKFTGAGMVDTLSKKFKAIKKIDDFAGTNEVKLTAVFKFAGILPGDLSSLLFGAMNISYKNYMIGANLGNLPLVIAYSLFGYVLKNVGEKPWVVAIPIVIIIVFLVIASLITKKMISDNKKNTEQAKEEVAE